MLLRALRALSQSHSSRNGKMEKFMPKCPNPRIILRVSPWWRLSQKLFVGAGFRPRANQNRVCSERYYFTHHIRLSFTCIHSHTHTNIRKMQSIIASNSVFATRSISVKRSTNSLRRTTFVGKQFKTSIVSVQKSNARVNATTRSDEVQDKLKELTGTLSEKWDDTEEKPAAVALGVFGLVGLIAADGVLHNIEGLPLIPNLFELIGIVFSGFFIYQNLLFKPDRQAFKEKVSKTFDDIL